MTDVKTEFETLETCPGCEGRNFSLRFLPDVHHCDDCRLLFRNPRPTQQAIAMYYDQGDTYEDWHQHESHFSALWQRRSRLVQAHTSRGRLLDVGGGDGGFLAAVKAAGYPAEGTELSETGASFARSKGLTVSIGQITDLEWPAESFDIITIWHVLEHLPNPGAAIRHLHRFLKPGGFLFVAVPNETHLILRHRLFGKPGTTPFGDVLGDGRSGCEIHLIHFQPTTLTRLLQREGFTIQQLSVDDYYPDRSLMKRAKVAAYRLLAAVTGWHCASALQVIARKRA